MTTRRSFIRYELGKKKGAVTTAAVGEEAGKPPRPGPVTTLAVGEEGAAPPPRPTTLVVGEESGSGRGPG